MIIERLSRVVARHRRPVIVAMAFASVAAAVAVLRWPAYQEVGYSGLLGGFFAIFVVSLIIANVLNRRRPRTFDVVPGGFATPRLGSGPLMISSLLPLLAAGAAVGWGEITAGRDRWPWIAGLLAATGFWAFHARLAWVGNGIRLTRNGLTTDGLTGSTAVPWEALDGADRIVPTFELPPPPPAPEPVRLPAFARLVDDQQRPRLPPPPARPVRDPEPYVLRLSFTRPDLVQRRGWVRDPRRVSYEGADDDFVVAAIRHYVAHPAARNGIGTPDELARLRAALPAPPPADRPVLEPGTTRTGVAARIAVIVAGLAVSAIDQVPGWLQWSAHAIAVVTLWNLGTHLHPLTWLRRTTRRHRADPSANS